MTAQDPAQRIITHMNDDHQDSVARYLEHYSKLSLWTASGARMTACDLSGMDFVAGGKDYRIPFEPPLGSLRETRERVVAMDKECLQALGRSDVTVKDYVPPTGICALMFAIIAAAFVAYSQRWWFAEGQVVERLLGPAFAKFSWTIQPGLFAAMVIIHTGETIHFIWTRLTKHSVSPRSIVWWQWTLGHFVEGLFSFHRFDELVRKKRAEKEKQKH